jgi:hypothetical protein
LGGERMRDGHDGVFGLIKIRGYVFWLLILGYTV